MSRKPPIYTPGCLPPDVHLTPPVSIEELAQSIGSGVVTGSKRERDLEEALLEFVRVEINFGHLGQHVDAECADCKRVRKALVALNGEIPDPQNDLDEAQPPEESKI